MHLINGHGEIEERINAINLKIVEVNDLYKTGKLENKDEEELKNEIENLKTKWLNSQEKLSFFIEHDELEKISKSLIALEENCKNKVYTDALEDGSEFIYWLKHFKEKDSLKLKNIF